MTDENTGQTIPLTEAGYAHLVECRQRKMADDLNELAAGLLPPGMRFEWTTTETEGH